jgi:hypothetical protein
MLLQHDGAHPGAGEEQASDHARRPSAYDAKIGFFPHCG